MLTSSKILQSVQPASSGPVPVFEQKKQSKFGGISNQIRMSNNILDLQNKWDILDSEVNHLKLENSILSKYIDKKTIELGIINIFNKQTSIMTNPLIPY